MLQLRNRYQIEKRRLENLQIECSNGPVESKWALYESLGFLSEHIPVRRSFRTMNCRRQYGEFSVKNEQETDMESDADQGEHANKDHHQTRKGSIQVRSYGQLIPVNSDNSLQNRPQPQPNRSGYASAFPRLTRMTTRQPLYHQQQQQQQMQVEYQRQTSHSVNRVPQGAEKFLAFGRFLTSSLIELPESQALMLVDQFTSELVQSYLKHHEQSQQNINGAEHEGVFGAANGHGEQLHEE